MTRNPLGKKGTYGEQQLPVAKKYPLPGSRKKALLLGLLGALTIAAIAVLVYQLPKKPMLANGPLSSAHANLEGTCASCHTAFTTIPDRKCSACHEKFGDKLGVFTFAAHYLYRSDDFSRASPSEKELDCRNCHLEHLGRDNPITNVSDSQCLGCHDFGSFNRNHPEFAAVGKPETANLSFAHGRHVEEIKKRENLTDNERACLYCHNPKEEGDFFEPIDFAEHCDACHLSATTGTPRLPVSDPAEGTLGVATLEDFRQSREPGTGWAWRADPNELRVTGRGKFVAKTTVHHKDPWIMANLGLLRGMLYPSSGLAGLLKATAEVAPRDLKLVYGEALATLSDQNRELSARPESEVQAERIRIDRLIREIKHKLKDPYVSLDRTKFLPELQRRNDALSPQQLGEIEVLMADLTKPCTPCHLFEEGLVARVQKDQRVLRRADFNHRAHIIQLRCLDCHDQIPTNAPKASGVSAPRPGDNASFQNLPGIETCRQCHQQEKTANQCVNCHQFHPNKQRRSDLLLYLD